MTTFRQAGYSPTDLDTFATAFEHAWSAVKDGTTEKNRDHTRDVVGKAVFELAQTGDSNPTHLANYAAYQGRFFIDTNVRLRPRPL